MPNSSNDIRKLRKILDDHLNIGELHLLAFDLGFDPDNLAGKTKLEKINNLIITLQRQDRLNDLVTIIQEERPHLKLLNNEPEQESKLEAVSEEATHEPDLPAPEPGLFELVMSFVFFILADIYASRNKFGRAILELTRTINLNPTFSLAYYERGVCYQREKQYDEALNDFNKAIELKPDEIDYHNSRGNVFYTLKSYEQAIEDYNRSLQLQPDSVFVLNNRANTYMKLGKVDQAFADYRRSNLIDPKNQINHSNMCWNGNLVGRAEEVQDACAKAVTLANSIETSAHARDSRGINFAILGNWEAAISDFQFFVETFQNNSEFVPLIQKRRKWIEALQNGENPFDDDTLQELKSESTS